MSQIEVRIPSDLVFERVVRAAAEEIGRQMNLDEERIADLTLAVSEAVTNAIEHGNQLERDIHVGVIFSIEAEQLQIQVMDQGKRVQALQVRQQGISEESLEQGQMRGLGLYIIHNLVDRVEFSSSEEGNTFTMWLHITPCGEQTRRSNE
ncbi:MAG: ATP-binding protein [Chloroflexia bacterium]|nr:ATP-binding protein [Chloroflexia bacterium]